MEETVNTPNWDILKDPIKYKEHLTKCFEKYDTDKSGFLNLEELQQAEKDVITELGKSWFLSFEDCYFKNLDKDQDGKISREEFDVHIYDLLMLRASKEKDAYYTQQLYVNTRKVARINVEQLKQMINDIKGGYTCGDVSIKACEEKIAYWEGQLAKNIALEEVLH